MTQTQREQLVIEAAREFMSSLLQEERRRPRLMGRFTAWTLDRMQTLRDVLAEERKHRPSPLPPSTP